MKNLFRIVLFLFVFVGTSYGQKSKLDNFTRLESKGDIPEDFIKLASAEVEEDFESNKTEGLNKDFFLKTRFEIKNLLLSGQVLFNDELTNYVNKVAKTVLRSEKELKKQLRFYVLKSDYVNALSTDQGIIFVTSGLIAQLENEAQLAFILAHEIAHFKEEHLRESYIDSKIIRSGQGDNYNLSKSQIIEKLSSHSKETELEADEKGIEMYLKTNYLVDEILSTFDVLLYSYLPFDDVIVDTATFNTEHFVIPSGFFPDSILPITKSEDYDDRNSTHPNIKKRTDAAFDYLELNSKKVKSTSDKKYQVATEEEFKELRNLARFENINIKIANRDYIEAVYLIYLLQRDFPDNYFLEMSMVKSLYGLAVYKNNRQYRRVTPKLKKIEGESYKLHSLFDNLSARQLNVLAYRFAFDMLVKYPSKSEVKLYEEGAKKNLALTKDIEFDKFASITTAELQDTVRIILTEEQIEDSIVKIDESGLSKYQKIKLKKELNAISSNSGVNLADIEFEYKCLPDVVSSSNLIEELSKIRSAKDEEIEIADNTVSKVIIIEPYLAFHKRSSNVDYLKTEKKTNVVNNSMAKDFRGLNLESIFLGNVLNSSDLVERYNEMGLINSWAEESFSHEDVDMINSNAEAIKKVGAHHGTDKLMVSAITIDDYKLRRIEFTGVILDLNTGEIYKGIRKRMKVSGRNKNLEFLVYYAKKQISTNTIEQ